jgi:4-nitrophenyl phosphatase
VTAQATQQDDRGAARILRPIRALISDLDGTLAMGRRPMPGLLSLLQALERRGVALTVVTNNTVRTPEEYRRRLAHAGAPLAPGQVLTASEATAAYLRAELPPASAVFVVGEAGLREALAGAGFRLIDDGAQPVAAVVVGGDRAVSHDKLKHAIRHVRAGARFIGSNPDVLVPTEDGPAPEAGVLLAAIRAGAGVAPTVIGKPERPLFDLALRRMGVAPEHAAVLGDRLDTDILGGQRLGLTTIFVTTGADAAAAVHAKGIRPDLQVDSLQALADLWEAAG